MFRRGKKVCVTAALVLALLFIASPGSAAPRLWQGELLQGWEGLWERVFAWFDGAWATAGSSVHEKTSSYIDPNGQPGTSSQSDSSAGVDPDG